MGYVMTVNNDGIWEFKRKRAPIKSQLWSLVIAVTSLLICRIAYTQLNSNFNFEAFFMLLSGLVMLLFGVLGAIAFNIQTTVKIFEEKQLILMPKNIFNQTQQVISFAEIEGIDFIEQDCDQKTHKEYFKLYGINLRLKNGKEVSLFGFSFNKTEMESHFYLLQQILHL